MRNAAIIERYQRISATRKPVIHEEKETIKVYCECGKEMLRADYASHRVLHDQMIPMGNYQLTMPYRTVNGLINRGKKFIPLLLIYSTMTSDDYPTGRALTTDYNALNLKDWTRLTDTNDTSIRWSEKNKRFVRTLW